MKSANGPMTAVCSQASTRASRIETPRSLTNLLRERELFSGHAVCAIR